MPEIQHYCTIRKDELEELPGGGLKCIRCKHTLIDLGDPVAVEKARKSGSLGCGFIRRLAVPAMASSLALSSCIRTNYGVTAHPIDESSKSGMGHSKPDDDCIISGGEIAPADTYQRIERPSLPVAERIPGKADLVRSPYTGKEVDIFGIPAGRKVIDPTTGKAKKLFLIPGKAEKPQY